MSFINWVFRGGRSVPAYVEQPKLRSPVMAFYELMTKFDSEVSAEAIAAIIATALNADQDIRSLSGKTTLFLAEDVKRVSKALAEHDALGKFGLAIEEDESMARIIATTLNADQHIRELMAKPTRWGVDDVVRAARALGAFEAPALRPFGAPAPRMVAADDDRPQEHPHVAALNAVAADLGVDVATAHGP